MLASISGVRVPVSKQRVSGLSRGCRQTVPAHASTIWQARRSTTPCAAKRVCVLNMSRCRFRRSSPTHSSRPTAVGARNTQRSVQCSRHSSILLGNLEFGKPAAAAHVHKPNRPLGTKTFCTVGTERDHVECDGVIHTEDDGVFLVFEARGATNPLDSPSALFVTDVSEDGCVYLNGGELPKKIAVQVRLDVACSEHLSNLVLFAGAARRGVAAWPAHGVPSSSQLYKPRVVVLIIQRERNDHGRHISTAPTHQPVAIVWRDAFFDRPIRSGISRIRRLRNCRSTWSHRYLLAACGVGGSACVPPRGCM